MAIVMMWSDGNGWGWGGWFMMAVMMMLFGGLTAGVVALVRYTAGPRRPDLPGARPAARRAEEVLAERFARGKIEYRRRLAVLRERR